jgi:hypothetical protein
MEDHRQLLTLHNGVQECLVIMFSTILTRVWADQAQECPSIQTSTPERTTTTCHNWQQTLKGTMPTAKAKLRVYKRSVQVKKADMTLRMKTNELKDNKWLLILKGG